MIISIIFIQSLFHMRQKKKSIEYGIFDENRDECENHNYLCKLIRNDSVEKFLDFTKKRLKLN